MTTEAYTTSSGTFEAAFLTWDEVTEILGHEHQGTGDDDEKLISHLKAEGAGEWVDSAEGAIDEDGWYLINETAPISRTKSPFPRGLGL